MIDNTATARVCVRRADNQTIREVSAPALAGAR